MGRRAALRAGGLSRPLALLSLVATSSNVSAAQPLENADFSAGLDGWDVFVSAPDVNGGQIPGTVEVISGRAILTENGSFLTVLQQPFVVPSGFTELSFDLEALPGFDTDEGGIPDAFEARLLALDGTSALPTFDPNSTAFFNLQQPGDTHLAPAATFNGTTVTLDTSGLPVGQSVILEFSLIGADSGATAAVAIDGLQTLVVNSPPLADAGEDRTLECGDTTTLDGRGTVEPDGDALAATWLAVDPGGDELLATSLVYSFEPALGAGDYRLVVDDGRGGFDEDLVTVTVEDTIPPVITDPLAPLALEEPGDCQVLVPDFSGIATDDACGDVTVAQDIAAGTLIPLGSTTTITVTATDGAGLSTSGTIDVSALDTDDSCNLPPVAVAGPDVTSSCEGTVSLDGSGSSDPEGTPLSYVWTDAIGTVLATGPTPTLDLLALGLTSGTHPITLTVSDGSKTASDVVVVTVEDDVAPTWDSLLDPIEIDESGSCDALVPDFSGLAMASDTCTDVVITQSVAAGTVLVLDRDPANNTVLVEVTATDAGGNAITQSVAVTVVDADDSCNTAPVADAGVPGTFECGVDPIALDGTGSSDADGDALAYSWLEAGTEVSTLATDTLVRGVGSWDFELTVSDGSKSGSDTVQHTVVDTQPPTIDTVAPIELDEAGVCEGVVPDLTGTTASDVCGGVTVTQSPAAGTPIALGSTVDVTLTATDAVGLADSTQVAVSVIDPDDSCNEPPLAVAGADQVVACTDAVSLDGSGSSDPNGTALSYSWTDASGTVLSTDVAPTLTLPTGVQTLTLTVSDGRFTASDQVVITVEDDEAPTWVTLIDSIEVDEAGACAGEVPDLTLLADAIDTCGDVTLSQTPAVGTPLALGESLLVEVMATDAGGNAVSQSVPVTVVDPDDSCNNPPVADAGPDVLAECGVDAQQLDGSASSDPDGDALAYSWVDLNGVFAGDAAVLDLDLSPGSYPYTLAVDDGRGGLSSDEAVLTVQDTLAPTFASTLGDQTLEEDGSCTAVVPDYTGLVGADDACALDAVVQSVAAGQVLAVGEQIAVEVTATDLQGLVTTQSFLVSVVDTDGSCDTGDCPEDLGVAASYAVFTFDGIDEVGSASSVATGGALEGGWDVQIGPDDAPAAVVAASVDVCDGDVQGDVITATGVVHPGLSVSGDTLTCEPIDFAAAEAQYTALAEALAALDANGTVDEDCGGSSCSHASSNGSNGHGHHHSHGRGHHHSHGRGHHGGGSSDCVQVWTGTDPALDVFQIDGATLEDAEVEISVPAGATVVVVVSGTDVDLSDLEVSGVDASQLMWVFPDALWIEGDDTELDGFLLAPLAHVDWDGDLDGAVVASSFSGDGAITRVPFAGDVCVHGVPSSFTQYGDGPQPVCVPDDLDSDGDGLTDAIEALWGSDPNDVDTDGDGLCDGPAVNWPLCIGSEDTNADGVLDAGETDPTVPDGIDHAGGLLCDGSFWNIEKQQSGSRVVRIDRGTGSGASWLADLPRVNALAQHPVNGQLYALEKRQDPKLYRIDRHGTVEELGRVHDANRAQAAAFLPNGLLYTLYQDELQVIDPVGLAILDTIEVDALHHDDKVGDIAWDPATGKLVGLHRDDGLLAIDPTTGAVEWLPTDLDALHRGDAAGIGPDGRLWIRGQQSGGSSELTLEVVGDTVSTVHSSGPVQWLDGASCATPDADFDGVVDALDDDDDNDGWTDVEEGIGGVDPSADDDGDGLMNYADPDVLGFVDSNGDGVDDRLDADGDGVPAHLQADGVAGSGSAGGSGADEARMGGLLAWFALLAVWIRRRSSGLFGLCFAALVLSGNAWAEDRGAALLGQELAGTVDTADTVDVWTFDATRGTRILIEDLEDVNNTNVTIALTDPYGRTLLSDDRIREQGPWILGEGEHTLALTLRNATTADYRLAIEAAPSLDVVLPLNTVASFSGLPAAGEVRYQLVITDAGVYDLRASRSSGGGNLQLLSPSGRQLVSNNVANVNGLNLSPGTYEAVVTQNVDANALAGTIELRGFGTRTEQTVTLGDDLTGSLAWNGDVRAFRLAVPDGTTLTLDGVKDNAGSARLVVRQVEATVGPAVYDGAFTAAAQVGPLAGGDYLVEVQSEDVGLGNFTVTVGQVSTITSALTVGTIGTVPFTAVDQVAEVGFTVASAGEYVIASPVGNAGSRYTWTLTNATDTLVLDGPANPSGPLYLSAGAYTLTVDPDAGESAPLDVAVFPVSVQPFPTVIGSTYNLQSADPGQRIEVAFTATSGQAVNLDFATTNRTHYSWSLAEAGGRVLATDDRLDDSGALGLVGGDYVLTLTPVVGAPGQASLTLVDLGPAATNGPGTLLALDDPFTMFAVPANDEVLFSFTLAQPERVLVEVENGQGNVFLTIEDQYGVVVDPRAVTNNDTVRGPLELGIGTWIARVENTSNQVRSDSIRVSTLAPEVVQPVALDAETSGTADPTAAYSFSLASDQAVFLDLTATSGDGTWALIGPNGAEIDRRSANNTGADLGRFELLAGDYQVRFDGAGTHSFVVRASVDATQVLPLGSFVDDAFAFAGDRLTLVVPIPVDISAYFRRLGAQVDVRVLDPVGRVVLDASGGINRTAEAHSRGGDWRVELTALQDGATYRAGFVRAGLEPVSLTLDHSETVAFTEGTGLERRWIDLSAPTRITVQAQGPNNSQVDLRLFDPDLRQLFSAVIGSDTVRTVNLESGRYLLALDALRNDAVAIDIDLGVFAPGDATTSASRSWQDLALDRPGERASVDFTATEGERLEAALGVAGPGDGTWRLLDPWGQVIASDDRWDVGAVFGPWNLPAGDYRFVASADDTGLVRADFRVGRDVLGDEVAYYSRNSAGAFGQAGRATLFRFSWAVGPDGLEFGLREPVATLPGWSDGIVLTPDADVMAAGLEYPAVFKIDPYNGLQQERAVPTTNALFHAGMSPDGRTAWLTSGRPAAGGVSLTPGQLFSVPLFPFMDPTEHVLAGDDRWVTSLAFVPDGSAFYATGAQTGPADLGFIDLSTNTTTRLISDQDGFRHLNYDPFTDRVYATSEATVNVLRTDGTLERTFTLGDTGSWAAQDYRPAPDRITLLLDQGEPLGDGRMVMADNFGQLVHFDYRGTGQLDASTPVEIAFLDVGLDDVIPSTNALSRCEGAPVVADLEPGSGLLWEAGTDVLVSGRVQPVAATRTVASVTANGLEATVDADGRFFVTVPVSAGTQTVSLAATERCGTYPLGELAIEGVSATDLAGDFVDVSSLISSDVTKTMWATDLAVVSATIEGTNQGAVALQGPLRLVLTDKAGENIDFYAPDGTGPQGPYLDVPLAAGSLASGATTDPLVVRLSNPLKLPLADTVRWQTAGNLPPRFVSAPDVDARADDPWIYDADAVDPNGTPISYALVSGPVGMAITPGEGRLTWTPTPSDVGVHTVEIAAADSFGATATQRFSLTVRVGAQNTPPVFVTAPVVSLDTGLSYTYDADAVDPDGDTVAYTLLSGPSGAQVDANGVVTWPGDVDGLYEFSLQASDGNGGTTTQSWTVGVGVATNPHAPLIVSSPNLTVGSGDLYLYQAAATDADNDVLSWQLLSGPLGLGLDTITGRLTWLTDRGAPGSYPIEIAVTDGTHAATQAWTLNVVDGPANAAPVFLSSPFKQAVLNVEFGYDAVAEDPEGFDVTYALLAGPSGMTVDPGTGEVRWTPSTLPPGNTVSVALEASDPQGNVSQQAFLITVAATNDPPTLDLGTPDLVVANEPWTHRVVGVDPDGFGVTYSLVNPPIGVVIDSVTGVLSWTALATQAGPQTLRVRVEDFHGLSTEGDLALTVDLDTTAPDVLLQLLYGRFCPGETPTFCVQTSDDQSVTSVELYQDGTLLDLDERNCTFVTLPTDAPLTFEAFASDRTGNVGTATRTVAVDECDVDLGFPAVTVLTPVEGERYTAAVDVVADLVPSAGADIVFWDAVLYPAGSDENAGVQIGTGTSAPVGGVVGTVDPTLLANGLWMVRVRAADSGDPLAAGTDYAGFEVGGDFKPGRFVLAFEDLTVDIPRTPVRMVRRYDTLDANESTDFGYGWDLDLESIKIQTNGPLGRGGWRNEACGRALMYQYVCWDQVFPHFAMVTWPNGDTEIFDLEPPRASGYLTPAAEPVFVGRDTATSTLRAAPGNSGPGVKLDDTGNLYTFIGGTGGALWDVRTFELTDITGTVYVIDKFDGLRQIRDRFGNTTDFREDGIVSSLGPDTVYERDAQGRISAVVDPEGERITYVYDTNGDLVRSVDRNGDAMEFEYDGAHRLLSYNIEGDDPIGVQVYGPDGRLESSIGAQGETISQTNDPFLNTITEVGPDPRLTTTMTYDDRGRMTQTVQDFVDSEGVPQSYVTTMTYNDRDLLETRTLPTGAVETFTYDAEERTTAQVDADGVLRETDYGPFSQVAERREDGELVERTEFGTLDLPARVFRGDNTKLREMTYDAWGRPRTMESGTGEELVFTYDGGYINTVTLPPYNGQPDILEVQFNQRGKLLSVAKTYPDGTGTTSYEYDGEDRRTAIVDPRGGRMSFTYDLLGRMESYTDKLGKTKFWTYDADGRELTMTNRNGEVLTRTYDEAGRLATMVGPGVDRELRYDPLGRRIYAREGSHVVENTYDVNGITSEHVYGLDSSGHVDATWSIQHDEAGRLVDLIGPTVGGDVAMTTTHTYDDRGRLETISEAAVGTFTYGYDAASRVSTLTRPNGMVTTHSYDDSGRVTALVTELLGSEIHSITTTYDDRGIPATQTDQEGTHVYQHDQRGRLTGVDHPDGAAFGDESYAYDQAERRTESHRDPASAVVYDDGDRLVQDATYTYQYDDEGRRVGRTHRVTGVQTTYAYSVLDQLLSLEEGGERWEYVYDARELRVLVGQEVAGSSVYLESFVYDLNGTVRGTYAEDGSSEESYGAGVRFGEALWRGEGEYSVRDRLGTVALWQGDEAVDSIDRDTYGSRDPGFIGVAPFGFTGHADDPSGLVWGRARVMEPGTGLWLTTDPRFNEPRYCYARNSPAIRTDPTGEVSVIYAVLAGGCLAALLSAGVSYAGWRQAGLKLQEGIPEIPDNAPDFVWEIDNWLISTGKELEQGSVELAYTAGLAAVVLCGASVARFLSPPAAP